MNLSLIQPILVSQTFLFDSQKGNPMEKTSKYLFKNFLHKDQPIPNSNLLIRVLDHLKIFIREFASNVTTICGVVPAKIKDLMDILKCQSRVFAAVSQVILHNRIRSNHIPRYIWKCSRAKFLEDKPSLEPFRFVFMPQYVYPLYPHLTPTTVSGLSCLEFQNNFSTNFVDTIPIKLII